MKAILTPIIVLLFGAVALAQSPQKDHKIKPVEKGIVVATTNLVTPTFNDHSNKLAVVFKYRNSLIKNSLTFTTIQQRYRWV